jgi:hypothetical protein
MADSVLAGFQETARNRMEFPTIKYATLTSACAYTRARTRPSNKCS